MKEDLLKHLLESVLGPSKSSRGARGEQSAVFTCPSCNHRKKKLTVNLVTQQFQCWVCNFKGHRAFKLLKEAKANPKAYDTLKSIDSEYKFKKSKQPKPDPTTLQLPKYLKGRGVTEQDIVKYNIHYSETGDLKNMVVIPSYDENGNINYYVGRSFDKNAYIKHKLAPATKDIIGFDLYINWDLPIILCEGAFDAMAIKRNAIPLFGKKISSTLMKKILTSNCNKVYLALDDDAFKDALDHAKKLMGYGKRVYFIEMEGKDPSELGFEKFTQLLYSAEELTPSSLVRKKLALS